MGAKSPLFLSMAFFGHVLFEHKRIISFFSAIQEKLRARVRNARAAIDSVFSFSYSSEDSDGIASVSSKAKSSDSTIMDVLDERYVVLGYRMSDSEIHTLYLHFLTPV